MTRTDKTFYVTVLAIRVSIKARIPVAFKAHYLSSLVSEIVQSH